jgi:hypothetical protein
VSEVVEYVDRRFQEEHLCPFLALSLDPPFVRYAQVTNGPGEQYWNMIEASRRLPICDMVVDILKEDLDKRVMYARLSTERAGGITGDGGTAKLDLTPFAVMETEKLLALSQKWQVTITVQTNERLEGTVLFGLDSLKQQYVRIGPDGEECCRLQRELGRPCIHMVALLRAAGQRMKGSHFHPFLKRLYCEVWHTLTWVKQYAAPPIALAPNVRSLERDIISRFWRTKPIVGRPPKKKEVILSVNKTYKKCGACGEDGHNARGCTEKDLDFYYDSLTTRHDADFAEDEDEDDDDDDDGLGDEYGDDEENYDGGYIDDEDVVESAPRRRSRGAQFVAVIEAAQGSGSANKRVRKGKKGGD